MQLAIRRTFAAATRSTREAVRTMASATPAPPAPKYLVLEYRYGPDILEKRGPYRADHIASIKAHAEAGKLVMAGAFGEPVEGGLFIWKDSTPEEIQAFVTADPYNKAGLVPSWTIKPYMVVVP